MSGAQGAHADDDVILLADQGEFTVSDGVTPNVRLTIHGEDGAPRPTIHFEDGLAGTDAISLVGNSTLRHLRIERVNGGTGSSAIFISSEGVVIEDVEVVASGTAQHGIFAPHPLTIRDTTVWNTGSAWGAAITLKDDTGNASEIRNVTAVGANSNAAIMANDEGGSGQEIRAVITNTIAVSAPGGYSDLVAKVNSQANSAKLDVSYSNYATASTHTGGCTATTYPDMVRDCGHNDSTPPLLASSATGDFHQLAGSPTIDVGSGNGLLPNETDLDGDPRTVGSAPDVGADEFVPPHTLTVSKVGTGQGTVTASPAGIDCGPACQYAYNHRTGVTLTATPAAGSAFTGWTGGGCTGTGTCTITLTADTTVSATFDAQNVPPVRHVLTAKKAGSGQGTITSSFGGISCGSACRQTYDHGARVTLTAVASVGSVFSGWTGGGCSGSGTCTVTVAADTTVTATFTGRGIQPEVPRLSGLAVSPRAFALTGRRVNGRCQTLSAANRKRPRCTRTIALQVGFRLNMPARVTITIARQSAGRLVKGRCVASTRANRSRRPCTLTTRVPGTLVRSGTVGVNRFTFNGRIGSHKLPVGAYTLTAAPVAGGLAGTAKTVTFVIGA